MGESIRQQKYGRLIQKELSDIFLYDKKGMIGKSFVSIVEVKMSPDLSLARVYISMMLAKDKKEVLKRLDLHKREIRKALGDKIRNQARIIPELAFFIDEVEEKAQRMDELIRNLHIPPAEDAS
ncbi:MAG: 30S ribosome-binding factor RbfA [Bacteroidetes bacterium]|nr:30S ribosome-binding factor RbfA [Bacteroidota bacterium]